MHVFQLLALLGNDAGIFYYSGNLRKVLISTSPVLMYRRTGIVLPHRLLIVPTGAFQTLQAHHVSCCHQELSNGKIPCLQAPRIHDAHPDQNRRHLLNVI